MRMPWPLLLGILSLMSAGCASPGGGAAGTAESASGARVVTSPEDAASLEASQTGWHVHDYWDGESRRKVVDKEITTGWRCTGCDAIPLRFRGDSGMIVPLGTARIEVVVEWTESSPGEHGQPELWVKPANASEPARVAPLQQGWQIRLNTTNDEADPPHQVLSRWEFWVMLPSVEGQAAFEGSVKVYAEAVRGLPIPPFPPHPDLWAGRTQIPLLDEATPLVVQRENVDEGSRDCRMACLRVHKPQDGVLVPYDASHVLVTLRYEPGMPTGLGLRAHGSDTWAMEPVAGEIAPPDALVFNIPVTATTGDSPYAKQSLWELEVFVDQPAPERAFVGGYRISAVAVKG